MSGYKFTNNLTTPALFSIPAVSAQTTIQSQGFKVFWADQNTTQGPLHLNFTLNQSTGGLLALFAPDAETIIDQIAYPPMNAGESFGRLPDGGSDLAKLYITTPGAPNQDSLPPLYLNGIDSRDGMLSVFPNPGNEYIQLVKAGDKIDIDYNLQVLDMQGRRVEAEFQELKSGKAWLIHTNKLSPGLYLAALTTKNEKFHIQFVIQ
jgi:hypothetical protein